VVLFISDTHLGHGDAASERAIEADLIACLRAHESQVEALYLLGDIFEAYIEWPHLIPRGFVRLQGMLAAWTDRDVSVTYLVGNHDPWHIDFFQVELGVRVVFSPSVEPLYRHNVYLAHGDGLDPEERWYRLLRPLLRHPMPVWLYRNALPADMGLRLARFISQRFGGGEPTMRTRIALRRHAQKILSETAADIVVMGHSHQPEMCEWADGRYVNVGSWRWGRTFGRLDQNGLKLFRWNGSCVMEGGGMQSASADIPPDV
jgi:UDP-2,3-diacylglucosamine hydrolase